MSDLRIVFYVDDPATGEVLLEKSQIIAYEIDLTKPYDFGMEEINEKMLAKWGAAHLRTVAVSKQMDGTWVEIWAAVCIAMNKFIAAGMTKAGVHDGAVTAVNVR